LNIGYKTPDNVLSSTIRHILDFLIKEKLIMIRSENTNSEIRKKRRKEEKKKNVKKKKLVERHS